VGATEGNIVEGRKIKLRPWAAKSEKIRHEEKKKKREKKPSLKNLELKKSSERGGNPHEPITTKKKSSLKPCQKCLQGRRGGNRIEKREMGKRPLWTSQKRQEVPEKRLKGKRGIRLL